MSDDTQHAEQLTLTFESGTNRADAKAVGDGVLALQTMVSQIQESFQHNEQVLIKARPFRQGSLTVPLDVIAIGAAVMLTEYPLLQKIREVITQFFDIKAKLRGQSFEVEEGNIIVINGGSITVDTITLQCLNPTGMVSQLMAQAFEDAENDPEITAVKISSSAAPQPLARIERPAFRFFQPSTGRPEETPGLRFEESSEVVVIRQPSFDPELVWRFLWRGDKIQAKVQDDEFNQRVAAGEKFAAGESLRVDLRRTQEYDPQARTYVNRQPYVVTRVHEHIGRPKQRNLF